MAQIIKRGNTYTIRVSAGFDSKGKRIKKNLSWSPDPGMTAKQIEKELSQQTAMFEKKVSSGSVIDSKIKFSEFADKWMKEHAEKHLAPKTVYEYSRLLVRINEAIGHIRLDKLRPYHLMEFYNNLAEEGVRDTRRFVAIPGLDAIVNAHPKSRAQLAVLSGIHANTIRSACIGNAISEKSAQGLSASLGGKVADYFKRSDSDKALTGNTIKHYHRLISTILGTAVIWQIIESNPCIRVESPKIATAESHYLDEEEAQRVVTSLENEPIQLRTMITLLIYSGFRRGELGGLQWPDIDFDNNVIHVRRVTQYLPHQGVFVKETKNKGSMRTIKISSIAFVMLRQFKTWQDTERLRLGEAWQSEYRETAKENKKKYQRVEWLFTTWNGMPIFPDTITNQFKEFTERNNLPYVGIHGLRHTNATLQIASGVNLRTVSNRLGHTQTSTTSNIYAHAIQSADAAAADTLENLLNPAQNKSVGHKVDTN